MAKVLTQAQIIGLAALLPSDRPYTSEEAARLGVNSNHRRVLVRCGFIVRRVRGVYHAAGLEDTLELRIAVLRLIVPDDCVVTDRTAAWLWGATMALAPGDHLDVPVVSVFAPPGRRLRNEVTASGERMLSSSDVVTVGGLRATTPLRTACDLLRLLHRDQSIAAADALAALGQFDVEGLLAELDRFKGYRGIVQARSLAVLVDPRSASAMESISRLRWHDAGLPWPECQVEVDAPGGSWYAIDIGLAEKRFGLEFFGEEFHGPEHEDHDAARLAWLREERAWTIVVVRKANVVGLKQDVIPTLHLEWARHTSTLRAG